MSEREQPVHTERALLGLAVRERYAGGLVRLRIRWGWVCALLLILFAGAWMTKTAGLYWWFKYQKGYTEDTFVDMLVFPLNIAEVTQRHGVFQIEEGIRMINEGNFAEGYPMVRRGLNKSKEHLEGRTIVAEVERLRGQDDRAIEILRGGLRFGGEKDFDYLRSWVNALLLMNRDQELMDFAEEYLPAEPEITQANSLVAIAAAQAAYFRGDFDRSEALLLDYNLIQSVDGMVLWAQISWDRGARESAIQKLENFVQDNPRRNLALIYVYLTRFYREQGDVDKALRYAIRRTVDDPMSAGARVEVLRAYAAKGDDELARRQSRAFLYDFRNEESAIRLLASYAAEEGDTFLARSVYELALENDFDIALFGLLFIEAHVVAGRYEQAVELCNEILKENPTWLGERYTANQATFNSLRAMAYFGIGNNELGQFHLDKVIAEPTLRAPSLVRMARMFRDLGRQEEARRLLVRAFEVDPENQQALSGVVDIDLALGLSQDLTQNLRSLLRLRRPSYELLARAYEELSSDRFIFAKDRENLLIQLAEVLRETQVTAPEGEGEPS